MQHLVQTIITVEKPVIDFLFVVIDLFRYLLQFRHYKRISVEVGIYRRGQVTLSANFRQKGCCPPTTVGVRILQ